MARKLDEVFLGAVVEDRLLRYDDPRLGVVVLDVGLLVGRAWVREEDMRSHG